MHTHGEKHQLEGRNVKLLIREKAAQMLEILSLLYSINTEMKACCVTHRSHGETENINSICVGLLKETLKTVEDPSLRL